FLTTGWRLYASRAGPVAAHTKSGPRIPASQYSRRQTLMLVRMSSNTRLSQPGRASSGRSRQTSQTEDERAAEESDRLRATRSVWMGQLPSTTKPARMIADTRV